MLHRLKHFLLTVAALLFLIEAWLWDWTLVLGRAAIRLLPWQAFKDAVARLIESLPPYAALVFFIIPVFVVEPLKIVAVRAMAHGHMFKGLLALVALKFVGVGVFAFIFDLTGQGAGGRLVRGFTVGAVVARQGACFHRALQGRGAGGALPRSRRSQGASGVNDRRAFARGGFHRLARTPLRPHPPQGRCGFPRLIKFRRRRRQFAEMRNDPVRAIFLHRTVGIAEIHRDHRHARRPRGGDIGLGIADHHVRPTCCRREASMVRSKRQRVRFGDAKRVLAADEGETIGNAELFQQQSRRPLDLVGADREKIAPRASASSASTTPG